MSEMSDDKKFIDKQKNWENQKQIQKTINIIEKTISKIEKTRNKKWENNKQK